MRYYPDDNYLKGWVAYYYNYTSGTYDKYVSTKTRWEDLPSDGVQVIARFYESDGKKRVERFNGHDVYLKDWETEEKIKRNEPVGNLVKFGEMLPDEIFHPLYDSILHDLKQYS